MSVSPRPFRSGRNTRLGPSSEIRPRTPSVPVRAWTIHTSVGTTLDRVAVVRRPGAGERRARPEIIESAMFVDQVTVTLRAGSGGPGSASMLREPFKPRGGPDGG